MKHKSMMKIGLIALVALLLAAIPLLGACARKAEVAPPEAEKWVKIGASLDLSGPLTGTHTPEMESVLSYAKMLNEKGGIAYKDPTTGKTMHVKLDMMWADDGYKVDKIISNYTRFKDAGAIVFVHGCTGADVALGDIAKKDGVPILHGGQMPMTLYPKYPGRWEISPTPTYVDAFGAYVNWIMANWKESRAPRLGFLTLDNPFGKSPITDAAIAYMGKVGMEYVGAEFYLPTDADVIPQITRLDGKGADFVFHNMVWEGFCTVMKSATDLGVKDHMNFCSNIFLFGRGVIEVAGEAAEGAYGVTWYSDLDTDFPGVKLLKEQVLKNYPSTHLVANHFDGWAYGVSLYCGIKTALEKVGYPITGKDFIDAMFTANGKGIWAETAGGCFPPIDFTSDPKDATGMHKVKIAQIQGGKIVELTDWIDCLHLSYAE